MTRSPHRWAVVAIAALLLSACTTGQEPQAPATTSPTATSAPATEVAQPSPSPTDPFAVPAEITPEYVERVLNEINRLDAELTKQILRSPVDPDATELPDELSAGVMSIYGEPLLELNTRGKLDLVRTPDQRDDLVAVEEYGQVVMMVEDVLDSTGCLVARVDRDFSAVDAEIDSDTTDLAFVFLTPAEGANSTGWRLSRLLVSDAAPDSQDETDLRALTMEDIADQAPEECAT